MLVASAIDFGVPRQEHHHYFNTGNAITQQIACPILPDICPLDIITTSQEATYEEEEYN